LRGVSKDRHGRLRASFETREDALLRMTAVLIGSDDCVGKPFG
jgi:hypothetical protein